MIYEYIFSRVLVGGAYNINNLARVDGEGNQIYLSKEVEAALPNKQFKMFCAASEVKFCFEVELTAGEQTTLQQTIDDHENNA